MLSHTVGWLTDSYRPRLIRAEAWLDDVDKFSGGLVLRGYSAGGLSSGISNGLSAGLRHDLDRGLASSARPQRASSAPTGTRSNPSQPIASCSVRSRPFSARVYRRDSCLRDNTRDPPRDNSSVVKLAGSSVTPVNRNLFSRPPRPASGSRSRPLGVPRTVWEQASEVWHPLDIFSTRPGADNPVTSSKIPEPPTNCGDDNHTGQPSRHTTRLATDNHPSHPPSSPPPSTTDTEHDNPPTEQDDSSALHHGPKIVWTVHPDSPADDALAPEDPRLGLSIGYQTRPELLDAGRHSRCFLADHSSQVVGSRPAELTVEGTDVSSTAPRLLSPAPLRPCSGSSDPGRCNSPTQRYVDCHRPQSAPSLSKEIKKVGSTRQHQYLPHYCNFVRGLNLRGRQGDRDDADDGDVTGRAATSQYDARGRRNRLASRFLENISTSRPNSPTTAGGQQVQGTYGSRLPIQIPAADQEHDVIDPSKAKNDETFHLVNLLTAGTTKDVKDLSRKPLSQPVLKKRSACPKKGRMPGKGRRKKGKKKQKEEVTLVEQGEANKEPEQGDNTSSLTSADGPDDKTGGKVPGLPNVSADDNKKLRRKGSRQLIAAPASGEKTPNQVAADEVTTTNYFDTGDLSAMEEQRTAKGTKTPSYLNDRMALSLQSSRFKLPMDMRALENLTPQDYLRKYCVVSPRRKMLYQKMFQKYREKGGDIQGKTVLCTALHDVLINTMSCEKSAELCDLLEVDDTTSVDLDLFCGISALAERILYPEFLTDDTADLMDFQREKIECADFCSLEWKLRGVQVNTQVRKILTSLG